MKTVADFVPFVEAEAQGAHTTAIQHAIRETVINFMRYTRTAVGELFLDLAPNQIDVGLLLEPCRRLVHVEKVSLAPKGAMGQWTPTWETLRATTLDQRLFEMMRGYWVDDAEGPQTTMWVNTGQDNRHRRLCVRYSWAIGRDICAVPDFIYHDYADVITNGAFTYTETLMMSECLNHLWQWWEVHIY
jgi:hypothetical protein